MKQSRLVATCVAALAVAVSVAGCNLVPGSSDAASTGSSCSGSEGYAYTYSPDWTNTVTICGNAPQGAGDLSTLLITNTSPFPVEFEVTSGSSNLNLDTSSVQPITTLTDDVVSDLNNSGSTRLIPSGASMTATAESPDSGFSLQFGALAVLEDSVASAVMQYANDLSGNLLSGGDANALVGDVGECVGSAKGFLESLEGKYPNKLTALVGEAINAGSSCYSAFTSIKDLIGEVAGTAAEEAENVVDAAAHDLPQWGADFLDAVNAVVVTITGGSHSSSNSSSPPDSSSPATLPSSGYLSVNDDGQQYVDVPNGGGSGALTMDNCINPNTSFYCYPADAAASDGEDNQEWQITYTQTSTPGQYIANFASDYSGSWMDSSGPLTGNTEYLSYLDTDVANPSGIETNVGLVPIQGALDASEDTYQYWYLQWEGNGEWMISPEEASSQCLTYVPGSSGQVPDVEACQTGDANQLWSVDGSQG